METLHSNYCVQNNRIVEGYHFNWDKTAMIMIIMRPVSGVRPSGDCENVKIPVPHYSKLILSHARHITFHEHRVDRV